MAINDKGQIVGSADLSPERLPDPRLPQLRVPHAFLYDRSKMRDLGSLGGGTSYANAINRRGQVVGGAATKAFPGGHAFFYSRGRLHDLGTLGGAESDAHDINSFGVIVGTSMLSSGKWSAFVYSHGRMRDLNTLLDVTATGYTIVSASRISDEGSILAVAHLRNSTRDRAVLLVPRTHASWHCAHDMRLWRPPTAWSTLKRSETDATGTTTLVWDGDDYLQERS